MTSVVPDCPFCHVVAREPEAHVLTSAHAIGFPDIMPMFPGHLLVAPRRHHVLFTDVPTDELASLMGAVQLAMRAVTRATGCEGHLLANNNVVDQTVDHLHWHVVPRTRDDDLGAALLARRPYRDGQLDAWRERLREAVAAERGG